MTQDVLLKYFADSLDAVQQLMAHVPDDRAAEQPAGIVNHPAWTLTHLCIANDFCLQCVGREAICPPGWRTIAGTGTKPVADRSVYPSKDVLLTTLVRQHQGVNEAMRGLPASHFEQPSPERVRSFAPTLGHIVAYMLTCHEHNHLGQLQAWKRAANL